MWKSQWKLTFNRFLSDLPGPLSFYTALENNTILLQKIFGFGFFPSPCGHPCNVKFFMTCREFSVEAIPLRSALCTYLIIFRKNYLKELVLNLFGRVQNRLLSGCAFSLFNFLFYAILLSIRKAIIKEVGQEFGHRKFIPDFGLKSNFLRRS